MPPKKQNRTTQQQTHFHFSLKLTTTFLYFLENYTMTSIVTQNDVILKTKKDEGKKKD